MNKICTIPQLDIHSNIKSIWLCGYYVCTSKLNRAKAHSLDPGKVAWHYSYPFY